MDFNDELVGSEAVDDTVAENGEMDITVEVGKTKVEDVEEMAVERKGFQKIEEKVSSCKSWVIKS